MNTPRSALHLAGVCARLALQGFGGVAAIAQHEFVEREHWMSAQEFVERLAAAQLLPGPNVINLAVMFGAEHFGARGVLAVLAGMLLLPLLLALLAVSWVQQQLHEPLVQGALRGMGLAAAGLLLGSCWKLAQPLRASRLGWPRALALAAIAFILVAVLRLPLLPVLLGLTAMGMRLAWKALNEPA